jgi:hypothetical protein
MANLAQLRAIVAFWNCLLGISFSVYTYLIFRERGVCQEKQTM